jgi:hypothetical protein
VNALDHKRTLAFHALATVLWTLSTCFFRGLAAQTVGVSGSVHCYNQGRNDQSRSAKNLVVVPVVPKGLLHQAEYTDGAGHYQLNLSWNDILKTNLTLRYVGKSPDPVYLDMFIGEDDYDRRSPQVKFLTEDVEQSCDSIELSNPDVARQVRDSIRAQRERVFPAGKTSSVLALGGSAISRLLLLASELGPDGKTALITLVDSMQASVQQIRVGRFLSYAHGALSQNLGFSVTPFRSFDEAVFSNPSALGVLAPPTSSIQIATGRFLRGSTIIPLNNRAGLGAGVYWLRQREDRSGRFNGVTVIKEEKFAVDEIQATVAGYASVSSGMSVGVSVEYIYQSFAVPIGIQLVGTNHSFIKDTLRRRSVDLGLSLSAHPARHFILGMALGQVFGTRVRFSEAEQRSLRTLDVGVAYLNGRLNLGVDERVAEAEGSGLGVGLNYVPLNHTVVVLGYSSAYNTCTIGLRYRNFSYTFEWSKSAFKKLVDETVIPDQVTHVIGGRFDL